MDGISNDKFENEMTKCQTEQLRAEVRQTLVDNLPSGRFQDILATRQMEALKAKTREAFMNVLEQSPAECTEPQQEIEVNDDEVESLKMSVRGIILAGVANGKLDKCLKNLLKDTETKKIEDMRASLRRTFVTSLQNGRLQSVLARTGAAKAENAKSGKKQKTAKQEDDLKMQIRQVLLKAATGGRLLPCLQEVALQPPQTDLSLLKEKARSALGVALLSDSTTDDLKLKAQSALENALLPESGADDLRLKAQSAIENALLADNRIESSTDDLKLKAQSALVNALLPESGTDNLRLKAQSALENALLADESIESSTDDLKLKAQSALANALLPESGTDDLRLKAQSALENALLPDNSIGSSTDDLKLKAQCALENALLPDDSTDDLKLKAQCALENILLPVDSFVDLKLKARIALNNGLDKNIAVQDLRQEAKQTLLEAARLGKISGALATLATPKGVEVGENVKTKARQALCRGLHTGELSEAFKATDLPKAVVFPLVDNKSLSHSISLAQLPSKPLIEPPTSRRMRRSASLASVEAVNPEPLSSHSIQSMHSLTSPTTPSRSRHLVIGGVTRGRSLLELQATLRPPSSSQMDANINGEEVSTSFQAKQDSPTMTGVRQNHKLAPFSFNAPEADRLSSKTANKLRAASSSTSAMSAMAMDLGLGQSPNTPTRAALPLSAFRFDLKPLSWETKEQKIRTSQSLGALQVTKSKQSIGMLPKLNFDKSSVQSIAWATETGSKWSAVGLRSSSVGVF